MKILFVEDSLYSLEKGLSILQKQGDVDVACDLAGALNKMSQVRYDLVVTDMCIHERGVRIESHARHLFKRDWDSLPEFDGENTKKDRDALFAQEVPHRDKVARMCFEEKGYAPEIKNAYTDALSRSVWKSDDSDEDGALEGNDTSEKLVEFQEALFQELFGSNRQLWKGLLEKGGVGGWYPERDIVYNFFQRRILRLSYHNNWVKNHVFYEGPHAFGLFVIREAIKQGIPFRVVTTISHGPSVLPAIIASGAIPFEADVQTAFLDIVRQNNKWNSLCVLDVVRGIVSLDKRYETIL